MSRPDWAIDGRDWPNRESSRFVDVGNTRWHVQIMGEGPVLLLLHGTGAATHSWRDLMPLLARRFTVVAPDLPGHGFTRARGMATLPAMARGVLALMAALERRPVLAMGHSAGAAILVRMAVDGALSAPIIALNGALLPFPGFAKLIFSAMARALFVNPFVPRLFSLQARAMGDVSGFLARSTGSKIDPRGAELYGWLFARSGHVEGALAMMANWDLDDLAARLPKLEVPLVLIAGEKDQAVPPSVSQRVAAIVPHGQTEMLAGLGHLAHEEAPDLISQIVMLVAAEHDILRKAGRRKGGRDDRSQ